MTYRLTARAKLPRSHARIRARRRLPGAVVSALALTLGRREGGPDGAFVGVSGGGVDGIDFAGAPPQCYLGGLPVSMASETTFALPQGCAPDSIILAFPVAPEFAGMRMDLFIQTRIPRLSRTRAQSIVKACGYRQNGNKSRASDLVRTGETVYLVRPNFEEPQAPTDLPVVYDDHAMLAINKPPGIPVHPSASYHRNTVSYILQQQYGHAEAPRIAHRLDRETSGLLLCSRTQVFERLLKNAFETRRMKKTYLAIVRGEMACDTGVIDMPIARPDTGLHLLMVARSDGLPSVTEYRVRARIPGHSLVELFPHTGRQHQLRVHLSEIGHSIIGDKLYGPEREAPFLESIETGLTAGLIARLGHERHALHAHSLSFEHPATHVPLTLVADLSPDMAALWLRLGGGDVFDHLVEGP